MKKFVLVVLFGFVLSGCGSSGDGSGPSAGTNVFPQVAGKYSFNTSDFKVTCTDGSTDTSVKISFNIFVSQDGNELTMTNETNSDAIPGISIIEQSLAKGFIKSDGSFILNQTIIAEIDGIPGRETINYSVTGTFSDRDFFGDYVFSVFFQNLVVTCEFEATFTGVKLET